MCIISIPIKQVQEQESQEESEQTRSIWNRKRDHHGLHPTPLDYWGRHSKYFDVHHLEKQFKIPDGVVYGAGDMHLDDWFQPDEFVRHAASDGILEVRMNVSDFKPYELQVRLNEESRVVTIEGRHNEAHSEHHVSEYNGCGRRCVTRCDSVHAHFTRSFTLSKAVLEESVEVQLTPDGHHLVLKAPVVHSPAEIAAHRRLCLENGRCANLVQCNCTFVEDKRG